MHSPALNAIINPNVDTLFNPYIPHNQVRHLPGPISHFLGYRTKPAREPPIILQWLLTLLATVAGICVVAAVYNYAPGITHLNPPVMVASLGASAVLDYNTIRSPLAQPRNSILGHAIAAIVGVGISKAFQLVPNFFANYAWLAAAVACALSSVAMSMTNTVHPPGGATAIIACTEGSVIAMGWKFPIIILLASVLMVAVACLFNNLLRQYPVFWWTPDDVGQEIPRPWKKQLPQATDVEDQGELKKVDTHQESASERTLAHDPSNEIEILEHGVEEIHLAPYSVRLPWDLHVTDEEIMLLKGLQAKIRMHSEVN